MSYTCKFLHKEPIDTYFRGLNPTEGEVQDIINQYDMDGSGNVRKYFE